jgi:chemotaxis protein CheZ
MSDSTVSAELAELRRFIDRRFAELSMEISATSQLMDYSESNISSQIATMKEQLAAVVALPSAGTRNSGLELEAVVHATEEAANRIMEAAEAIGDWLSSGNDNPALRANVNEKVNAIFEACSFQDLTSQRIRRAIDHLHQVESMLGSLAANEPPTPRPAPAVPSYPGADLAQAEIDRMMASF